MPIAGYVTEELKMGLLGGERSLTIFSAVWTEHTNVTDGRQTPGDSKERAYAQRRAVKTVKRMSYTDWGLFSQASCDRMDPLCRQRHLLGYRSRTRTLILTITLKLTVTLTLFFTLTRTLKIKENKNDTGIQVNIGLVIFITYFTGGQGWVYQRPISETGSFSYWIHAVARRLSIFTFAAFCYKYDICISRIVTQNTLKCAIPKAKFQNFSGEATHPLPSSSSSSSRVFIQRITQCL